MGPRSLDRGNRPGGKVVTRGRHSSMGPRSLDRGNAGRDAHRSPDGDLFNGAAISRSRKCPAIVVLLKGGTVFNGAAISRSRKCPAIVVLLKGGTVFNGAAISRSRK